MRPPLLLPLARAPFSPHACSPPDLEAGWTEVSLLIKKLHHTLNTDHRPAAVAAPAAPPGGGLDAYKGALSQAEASEAYRKVYIMCTQRSPYNFSDQLYSRYGDITKDYDAGDVLPALRTVKDVFLLKELDRRWRHQEVMNAWMFRFFNYLDRYYADHHNCPTLVEASACRAAACSRARARPLSFASCFSPLFFVPRRAHAHARAAPAHPRQAWPPSKPPCSTPSSRSCCPRSSRR